MFFIDKNTNTKSTLLSYFFKVKQENGDEKNLSNDLLDSNNGLGIHGYQAGYLAGLKQVDDRLFWYLLGFMDIG